MTSAHVFYTRPFIKQTSSQQSHCKCSLLSNQTKQVRLHKHSCLAIKSPEWSLSPPLSTASTLHYPTLLSSSFEVIPHSSPLLASLPSAVLLLLHYQPTAAALSEGEQQANVAVTLPEPNPPLTPISASLFSCRLLAFIDLKHP